MKAAYMLSTSDDVSFLQSLDEEGLIEALDREERSHPDDVVYIDDTWDAMHFVLCERTTANPIEGNGLSEAIVGVNWFDEDNEDAAFIAWSGVDDCKRLADTLRKIKADELPSGVEPKALIASGAYRAEWFKDQQDDASLQLMHDFAELQALYLRAVAEHRPIVVSFL